MTLSLLDGVIVVATLLASLAIGVALARRGAASTADFFVAGRRLGWLLAGTSLVATSFAADTPLAIARIVRTSGLQGNWYWWSGITGFAVCMFFFAPLWQRSGLITDAELVELRYGGKPARVLRSVMALHFSIVVNGITMGWVLLGMQKILGEAFGWPPAVILPLLILLAVIYTGLSGLWGVVATDLLQFLLAMTGSLALMGYCLAHFGGPRQLASAAVAAANRAQGASPASPVVEGDRLLSFLPDFELQSLGLATFLFYIFVQWWGGAQGGGFLVQRLLATRDERHAVLTLGWFQIAHFVLRTWPWIVVALASIVFFPDLEDPELAYPKMMIELLPHGLLGLMVAALLAAFLSTLSTHLNWGASYLVSDFYRPLIARGKSERHYVVASRLAVAAMAALGGLAAWQMDSILAAWILLMELQAGAILIWILRWFWWRINAWSEISALASSLVVSNLLRAMGAVAERFPAFEPLAFLAEDHWYPARFCINLALSTAIALAVTMLTPAAGRERLRAFVARVRPPGAWPGLRPVPSGGARTPGSKGFGSRLAASLTMAGIVYASLLGIGWLVLGDTLRGLPALAAACVAGAVLLRWVRARPELFFQTGS